MDQFWTWPEPVEPDPDPLYKVKALVVTPGGKHFTEWDSTFWETVDQALEAVQRLSSPTVCVIVSDDGALNAMSRALTHSGARADALTVHDRRYAEQIIRQLGLMVYRHGIRAAFGFPHHSHVEALDIRDVKRHRLLKVMQRREAEPHVAIRVRRSYLWRLRSEPRP